MTLADLESFVTGPAIFKCENAMAPTAPAQAQKRKPECQFGYDADDPYNIELIRITMAKILTQPVKRVEPSLKRFLLLKNLWRDLQCSISSQSPCKRINLDIDPEPADPEMIGESAALHGLHMSTDSVATKNLPPPEASQPLPSIEPLHLQPIHFLPLNTKEPPANNSASLPAEMASLPPVIESPTEFVDLVPSYDNSMDFQSLVQCSMDQLNGNTKPGSVEELDSIMQVLVGM